MRSVSSAATRSLVYDASASLAAGYLDALGVRTVNPFGDGFESGDLRIVSTISLDLPLARRNDMREPSRSILMCLALGLAGVPGAFASDGVLEINQACALSGCFSGDAPSFPVTIDGNAGTSYLLTSSLLVPNENTTAILITAGGVSLDLNGFSIRGITNCNFLPYAVCAPVGNGHGVSGLGSTLVRNGTVSGMGGYGLDLGFDSVAESVRALYNGLGGVQLGPGSSARAVTANANGGSGLNISFRGGAYSTIATNNNVSGIRVGEGSIVRDSVVNSNGMHGIECSDDCLATANEVTRNFGAGFLGPNDCLVGVLAYGGNMISPHSQGYVVGCSAQIGTNVCGGPGISCP